MQHQSSGAARSIWPLALRASQAAAALGVSENQLRQWVSEGLVHRPYRVRKHVVLFDAVRLAEDWDRIKLQATSKDGAVNGTDKDTEINPWDAVLR